MTRWTIAGVAAAAGAVVCAVVAYLQRDFELNEFPVDLQGAYFNRSEGAPAYSAQFGEDAGWFDTFSFSNPYLWLGAAVALALMSVVILALARRPAR